MPLAVTSPGPWDVPCLEACPKPIGRYGSPSPPMLKLKPNVSNFCRAIKRGTSTWLDVAPGIGPQPEFDLFRAFDVVGHVDGRLS
jgi:hypothetical protein